MGFFNTIWQDTQRGDHRLNPSVSTLAEQSKVTNNSDDQRSFTPVIQKVDQAKMTAQRLDDPKVPQLPRSDGLASDPLCGVDAFAQAVTAVDPGISECAAFSGEMANESLSVSSVEQQHDLATGNSTNESLSDIDSSVVRQSEDFLQSVSNVLSVEQSGSGMRLEVEQFGKSRVSGLGTPSEPPNEKEHKPETDKQAQVQLDQIQPLTPRYHTQGQQHRALAKQNIYLSEHQRFIERQQRHQDKPQKPVVATVPESKVAAMDQGPTVMVTPTSELKAAHQSVERSGVSMPKPMEPKPQSDMAPFQALQNLAMQSAQQTQTKNRSGDHSVHIGHINVTVLADEPGLLPQQPSSQQRGRVESSATASLDQGWASKHYLRSV